MESDTQAIIQKEPTPKTEKSALVTQPNAEKSSLVDNNNQNVVVGEKQQMGDGNKGVVGETPSESGSTSGNNCCAGLAIACWRVFCFPVTLPLLFIKIFYFTFIGGLGSILPFLSIYFKQMGLSPEQIGIISGLRPLVGFLSGPLWGALADRYKIRRIMLLLSILAWVAVYVALAFVPSPDRLDSCPTNMHPHRKVYHLRSNNDADHVIQNGNTTTNVTDEEYEILKESIGWMYEEKTLNKVFFIVLVLILLGEFFQSPTTSLSDAGTIQELGIENLDYYGGQRAWGPIGWAVSSLSVGALVAATRRPEVICGVELFFSEYFNFVYVFIAFMTVAFLSATQIQFKDGTDGKGTTEMKDVSSEKKQITPQDHSTIAVIRLFMNVHYGSWLSIAFFVGVCNGVIWGFLYWHLDNLGADQLLIGTASGVCCLSEFIMFFFVPPIIKLIGHMGIMYIGLFMYAIRFAVYGALVNPWWVLPVELLQGVTFSLIWVSLTAYSALSVPSVSLATVQGILHGVYFGLGNGTGHLIGGSLIGLFGAPLTFYTMSGSCIVALVIFWTAQKLSRKPDFSYQHFDDSSEPVK